MSNGMLDNYLIAQALGWNWDLGTILLLTGIEFGLFILMMGSCFLSQIFFDSI